MKYRINRVKSVWWVSTFNEATDSYMKLAGFTSKESAQSYINMPEEETE